MKFFKFIVFWTLFLFSGNSFAFLGFGEPDCNSASDCINKAKKVEGEERAEYYGKACEDYRYWLACFNAGSIYHRHVKDDDKAIKYYKIGCDIGSDSCCTRLKCIDCPLN